MANQPSEGCYTQNGVDQVLRTQSNRYVSLKHDLLKLQPLIWRNPTLAFSYETVLNESEREGVYFDSSARTLLLYLKSINASLINISRTQKVALKNVITELDSRIGTNLDEGVVNYKFTDELV